MSLVRFSLLVFLCLVFPSSLFAYTDDIKMDINEVWQGTRKVIETIGIKKIDDKKREIESKWVEDEVMRRNELFKGWMSQVYRRRYRIRVSMELSGNYVKVQVRGHFQEKPKQSGAGAPWRKVKMEMQDFDVERVYFMRILAQITKDRGGK